MKISLKIFLGYFLLVGLAAWFVLTIFVDEVKPGVRQAMEDTLVDTANVLAELAVEDVKAGNIANGGFARGLSQYQARAKYPNKSLADISGVKKQSADYRVYITDAKGIVIFDKIKLRAPVFGDLTRKSAIARFTRTLGTLVTSGVPILQALNITKETAGNVVLGEAITKVHDAVKEGESIVAPLEASGVFPPMVISMVDVGEETGQLPEMLLKVAEVYDDEVDNAVESLTSLLEPIMIVFLAFIVGTIVIALFMPLIEIINKMQSPK